MDTPQLAVAGTAASSAPRRADPIGAFAGGFFAQHPHLLELVARVVFGVTVILSAVGQLLPGGPEYLASRIPTGPGPWFAFWSHLALSNPHAFATAIAAPEFLLGFAILLGCLRKVLYSLGMVLSLFLWSTIEGLSSGVTARHSLGSSAGLLYLVGLLLLITLETTYGPDSLTIDAFLSRRFEAWGRWSNFIGRREALPPPTYMIAFAPRAADPQDGASENARTGSRPPRRSRG